MASRKPSHDPTQIRCAIYTRKSTEDGLEQEFNSLDAQFEACAAYIASQRHECWKMVNKRYDDGGISGGTMDRPGLKALLQDIDAGLVDRIVVYKIDRLTRSLGDFSRIVDQLDAKGASFVSVTQSFNTATSMGRLTLNMLLSFAQFEREVTAERIRDKIAASKAKGLWMGENVPLGYDIHPDKNIRGLVANIAEAKTVRAVFEGYAALQCLAKGERSLAAQGLSGKPRKGATSGVPLSRGAIHKILTNPIYKGKIRHKDKLFDGQHEALINEEDWDVVQLLLQSKSAKRRGGQNAPADDVAPLRGKIFDNSGKCLTPTHTRKSGKVIRYYISNRLLKGKDSTGLRFPARTLEPMIADMIVEHLIVGAARGELLQDADVKSTKDVVAWVDQLYQGVAAQQVESVRSALCTLRSAKLEDGLIHVDLELGAVAKMLGQSRQLLSDKVHHFNAPFTLRRRGVEAKLITGTYKPEPDQALINALVRAHDWVDQLKVGTPMLEIAKRTGTHESVLRTRIRLAYLSPKIQAAIMTGTQPTELTLAKLKRIQLSNRWDVQEQQLGLS